MSNTESSKKFKYYGTLNYKFAHDYGLNLSATALFGYMFDVYGKPWMTCDSEGYCWLQKSKIQKECPILNFETDTIGRYLKKLADLGLILRKTVDGKKSYYKLTAKAQEWDFDYIKVSTDEDPTSDSEHKGVRIPIHSSADTDPIDNTNYYNKNQNIKEKEKISNSGVNGLPNATDTHDHPELMLELLNTLIATHRQIGGACSKHTVATNFKRRVWKVGRKDEFLLGYQNMLNRKAKDGTALARLENFIRSDDWEGDIDVVPGEIRIYGAPNPVIQQPEFVDPFAVGTSTVIDGECK